MAGSRKRVGVLALQGDFSKHSESLERAGAEAVEVRTKEALGSVDALVMPGGESTTMLKLIGYENLWDSLRQFGEHKPVFGTCAGAILLAKHVLKPSQMSLDLMDLDVERNAYGRASLIVISRKSTLKGNRSKPSSFARPSSGASGRKPRSSPPTAATRCSSRRANTWWRPFIRSLLAIHGFTRSS